MSRGKTILAVWKFLTQYDSYAEAYENEDETRMLTDKGVMEYERVDLGELSFVNFEAEMEEFMGPTA